MTPQLYPESLERSLPWIRAQALKFAHRWPSIEADELESAICDRWLTYGRVYVPWVAVDLLRKKCGRNGGKMRAAEFSGRRELPEPPEDAGLAREAYILECRSLGATFKEIAQELDLTPAGVGGIWARAKDRRGNRWRRVVV